MTDILVASPHMNKNSTDLWRYSVVVTAQQTDRTLGFIMNQPVLNIDHKQITTIYGLKHTLPRCTVYCGGPLHTEKVTIIHSPDWQNEGTQQFTRDACITFNDDIVTAIVQGRGPHEWKIMLGYSEWADGQLDAECMRAGGWLTQSWDSLVWSQYKRKEKMWRRIMEKQSVIQSHQFLDRVWPE